MITPYEYVQANSFRWFAFYINIQEVLNKSDWDLVLHSKRNPKKSFNKYKEIAHEDAKNGLFFEG